MGTMKKKNKLGSLEDAIVAKFPNVSIHEVRTNKFGTRILGVVPAKDEYDDDHIVEWTEDGKATECRAGERDFREVGWDKENKRPIYVCTKILLSNDSFSVNIDATT